MKILIVEPYLTGSHAAWVSEYTEHSRHDVSVLSLPGHHWKWRMHGGAVTLARHLAESGHEPDLIVGEEITLDMNTPFGQSVCSGRIVWTNRVGAFYIWGLEYTQIADDPQDPLQKLIEESFP